MNEEKPTFEGGGILAEDGFKSETKMHKVNEKQRKIDQNAIIDELEKLRDSDNPEDQELLKMVEEEFQSKITKFNDQMASLPRKARRKFLKNNRFSNTFKRRIGL